MLIYMARKVQYGSISLHIKHLLDSWFGSEQLCKCPNVIGETRFHCWRDAQRLVYPAEIVIREVQSASGELPLHTPRRCRRSRKAAYWDHGGPSETPARAVLVN